jgi:chromosome segregation ATPase
MAQNSSKITDYQSNYDKIINDPIYEEIKLNKKLNEELNFSETLCNQLKNEYETLEKYCKDLQNNFNNFNNILREKQELKKKIGDLDDHNSKLIKLLVETLEEKNNVIQENDNVIREKDKKIQATDNLIKEKDNEIQEKDKIIQEKDDLIQRKDNLIKGKDELNQRLKREIHDMHEKYNEIQVVVNKLEEQYKAIQKIQENDNIIQEKDSIIQEKDSIIQEMDNKLQKLVMIMIQEKEENIKLRDEASKYQYALGVANDTRLSDNDEINPVKLRKDILSLQDSLKDYTICKGKIEINTPRIHDLLKKYGSNTIITVEDQNKLLARAVLQRHVIEQIFEYAKEYFDKPDNHQKYTYGTETHIFRKVRELIELTRNFEKRRAGIDDSTKVLPIKLRQQVCAALGNRGFNDMVDNNNRTFPHYFISHFQNYLNEEISKYRRINDPEKKKRN